MVKKKVAAKKAKPRKPREIRDGFGYATLYPTESSFVCLIDRSIRSPRDARKLMVWLNKTANWLESNGW